VKVGGVRGKIGTTAEQAAAGEGPLLPGFFPLVDKKKACKSVAEKLFDCIDRSGKQEEGVRDASVGKKVYAQCKAEIEAYSSCMVKAKADQNLKLVRAPPVYLEQLEK